MTVLHAHTHYSTWGLLPLQPEVDLSLCLRHLVASSWQHAFGGYASVEQAAG
jgi:hypothetical protein